MKSKDVTFGPPHFREVGQAAGLDYHWEISGKRPLNILQTIGNGCAFLDYDHDGNLDILLVGPKLALYHGDGQGHFTDVTHAMGLDRLEGHFLGCAVGDYDNDGFDDIYISGYQTGVLLHNEGGRGFRDVTRALGLKPQPWGTSCGFADLDGDGYLDLYIANYAYFDPKTDLLLCPYHGTLTGCGPKDYEPCKGVIYHNEKGQGFRDVTKEWNMAATGGRGLGVAFADFDGSGHVGLAIANDLIAGDLFENTGQSKWKNIGVPSGTAVDPTGDNHAGMGIDWGDYDNDGRLDLFVTTFSNETKCLYHNEGNGVFTYQSEAMNLDRPTLPYVAWGCKFFDADNDGWLDLILANGHVQDNISHFEKETYRQPVLFLRNRGKSHAAFEDATRSAGLGALPNIVGRGLAVGDFDNDGRVDVLVVDSEGKPLLLHNETQAPNESWVGFRLVGKGRSNRNAYGALITLETNGQRRVRQCQSGGSYLSSSDARVHFGLGKGAIERVIIRWPDGMVQVLPSVPSGRYITVTEGETPTLPQEESRLKTLAYGGR
ncbi:MAG TPA: CRTAC1 family protein [Chthonomonadaceae bacterium]|nr:CRTAC1 family protein [Chthonomonadaceae bacterium]